ncbi:MAG: cryptochrome/photolyase family protein [Phycisphaerales bacterium]|nr:MAG: cryptochrome/photolyase family protein [Phycisphaerales bacterium]
MRTLVVVLGDQLSHEYAAIKGIDPERDAVLMMEVAQESEHVPSHAQRTIMFLSAMRHFALELQARGVPVRYARLEDPANTHSFDGEVAAAVRDLRPERIVVTHPGEHRVLAMARAWEQEHDISIEILPDTHFLTDLADFNAWTEGKKEVRMEHFYRRQRRALRVLMDQRGEPVGGAWNFDKDNRKAFGKHGPDPVPTPPQRYEPDAVTREVISAVRERLPGLPGRAERFDWPVTRADALRALDDFITRRLPMFGPFEDAMWTGEPVLWHARLSAPMNLKLLDPREVVKAALDAYRRGKAPIESVEGFVRQVIGWREFIRAIYWREGPGYERRNALEQHAKLPAFYWTAETDMACLRECVGQVLDNAYGHHIQRLMVTGNYALIAGVHPKRVADWYLGMYADGVDWVTLPNTLGMAMHADGGVVGSKPYAASGKYIQRMSNYCKGCRYDPGSRHGEGACPVTVFYWDFLIRNEERFRANTRMALTLKHVEKMPAEKRTRVTVSAGRLRAAMGIGEV